MASGQNVSGENRGPMILGVSSMMAVLVTISLALRSWVRGQRKVKYGPDDGLLMLSFFLLWLYFTSIALQVIYGGLGKPLLSNYHQDPMILVRFLQILFAQEIMSPVVLSVIKLSILALYWRLFPTAFMRASCITVSCIVVASCFAFAIPGIFRCSPISKAWSPYMVGGSCSTSIGDWIAWQDGVPEFVTSIVIFGLPIYEISRLSASLQTMVAISAVFALASLSMVSSIVRFVLGYKAHENSTTIGGGDATLDSATLLLWTNIEVCTAFIAACLPSLRPLYVKVLHKIKTFSRGKSKQISVEEVVQIDHRMHEDGKDGRILNHVSNQSLFNTSTTTSNV